MVKIEPFAVEAVRPPFLLQYSNIGLNINYPFYITGSSAADSLLTVLSGWTSMRRNANTISPKPAVHPSRSTSSKNSARTRILRSSRPLKFSIMAPFGALIPCVPTSLGCTPQRGTHSRQRVFSLRQEQSRQTTSVLIHCSDPATMSSASIPLVRPAFNLFSS
jgi:hypothetical protein